MLNRAVAVVLEPHFGSRLMEMAQRLHVWVCVSSENQSAVQAVWAMPGLYEEGRGATIFGTADDPEAIFLNELDTIDLHHPAWQIMEVYGLALTPKVQQALEEYGVVEFSHTTGGFLATRPPSTEI